MSDARREIAERQFPLDKGDRIRCMAAMSEYVTAVLKEEATRAAKEAAGYLDDEGGNYQAANACRDIAKQLRARAAQERER